jgi:hypothetical protein
MVNFREFFRRTKLGQSWPIAAALLLTFSLAPAGHASLVGAIPVAAGGSIIPSPLVPGYDAGTLLADETEPFSYTTTAGTNSGTITSAVFMETGGTLDFYYQVWNSSASATALQRETDVNFGPTSVSLAYSIDSSNLDGVFVDGTVAPVSGDLNATGTVVGFSFFPPIIPGIAPGTTTNVLVVSTTATTYGNGNANVIDGGVDTVAAYQPGSPVPEPMSMFLFGGGLLALGGFSRLRKRLS